MNSKGFTLVEVLAMLVVLGIIVGITVPNVTGILGNQKTNMIIESADDMISSAKTEVSTNDGIKLPQNNSCILLTLAKIDKNSDIKATPEGEAYDCNNSFVLIKKNNKQYEYHVRLIAKRDNGKYYGIKDATESQLSDKNLDYIAEFSSSEITTTISKGTTSIYFSSGDKFKTLCSSGVATVVSSQSVNLTNMY